MVAVAAVVECRGFGGRTEVADEVRIRDPLCAEQAQRAEQGDEREAAQASHSRADFSG